MEMPGRTTGTADRYGFNGKEKDRDINSLTAYDYGFRVYNPGIGRFLSEDPLTQKFAELTPYQYASNTVIAAVDLDGQEARIVIKESFQNGTIQTNVYNAKDFKTESWNTLKSGQFFSYGSGNKQASGNNPAVKWVSGFTDYITGHGFDGNYDGPAGGTLYVDLTDRNRVSVGYYPQKIGEKPYSGTKPISLWETTKRANSAGCKIFFTGDKSIPATVESSHAIKEYLIGWMSATIIPAAIEAATTAAVSSSPILTEAVTGSSEATTAVESGGQLLLKPGAAKLTQDRLEHIVFRHWFTSGAKGAGKFIEGTTAKGLKEMIQTATTKGIFRPNTLGRPGTIAEFMFDKIIGTTSSGVPTSNLRVVINSVGKVITAFPF